MNINILGSCCGVIKIENKNKTFITPGRKIKIIFNNRLLTKE